MSVRRRPSSRRTASQGILASGILNGQALTLVDVLELLRQNSPEWLSAERGSLTECVALGRDRSHQTGRTPGLVSCEPG